MSIDEGAPDASEVFDDGEYEYTVDDPEDYTQRKRLQELFTAREKLAEFREEIAQARLSGNYSEQGLRTAYRTQFEVYLRELEPLITKYPRQGQKHWWGADLGVATFQPLRNDAAQEYPDTHVYSDYIGEPTPHETHVVGLREIVNGAEYEIAEFEVSVGPQGNETHQWTERRQLPFHILDRAHRHTNAFMSEIGLEATENDKNDEYEQKFTEL